MEVSLRDGRSLRTRTIWNNKDPVFNQVLSFVVDDPENQSITAMVKDDDMHAFSKVRPNCACMHLLCITTCISASWHHAMARGESMHALPKRARPCTHLPTQPAQWRSKLPRIIGTITLATLSEQCMQQPSQSKLR